MAQTSNNRKIVHYFTLFSLYAPYKIVHTFATAKQLKTNNYEKVLRNPDDGLDGREC
jgi:hypothetical protein